MIINPGMSEETKGGVSSFNGRTGAGVAQAADYKAAMVGAATMQQVNTAIAEALRTIETALSEV